MGGSTISTCDVLGYEPAVQVGVGQRGWGRWEAESEANSFASPKKEHKDLALVIKRKRDLDVRRPQSGDEDASPLGSPGPGIREDFSR